MQVAIGDDIHAVTRDMKEKLGINIFAFSCEGYRGVSQSAGHHIANNGLFKHVIGLNEQQLQRAERHRDQVATPSVARPRPESDLFACDSDPQTDPSRFCRMQRPRRSPSGPGERKPRDGR